MEVRSERDDYDDGGGSSSNGDRQRCMVFYAVWDRLLPTYIDNIERMNDSNGSNEKRIHIPTGTILYS